MASHAITTNGRALKRQAEIEGLDRECLRLKSPFKHHDHCNSVFTAQPVSTGGGSGMSTLALFAGGLTVAAAATPLVLMALSSGGSQGPQGAGQVSSKAMMNTLDNAESSGNPDVINKALDQARPALASDNEQIKAAEATISGSKEEIANIQGKVDQQKNSVSSLKDEIKDLKGKVDGDKSSSALTGQKNKLTEQKNNIKDDPKNPGAAEAQRQQIQSQITELEKQIKTAQEIEQKIKDKETQLPKEEEKLKDFEQQLKIAKEKAEKAKEQLQKLKPERDNLKAKIERLERQLQNIQAAKSTNGTTAPVAEDTPPPMAAATHTSEELGKDLLKDLNSDGTTPAANPAAGSDKGSDTGAGTGTGSSPVGAKPGDATEDDSYSKYTELSDIIENKEAGYSAKQGARGELLTYIKEHPNAKNIESLKRLAAECDTQ